MNLPAAGKIFEELRGCQSLSYGRNEFMISKIWELFSLLLESSQTAPQIDFVDSAVLYIKQNFSNAELSVAQIANELNIDRAYFSTIFSKKKGMSPRKYIISYRMKIAAELLINHNQSVTVTAKSVGYDDICNFSKIFKSFFGLSPREYIKKHKESST